MMLFEDVAVRILRNPADAPAMPVAYAVALIAWATKLFFVTWIGLAWTYVVDAPAVVTGVAGWVAGWVGVLIGSSAKAVLLRGRRNPEQSQQFTLLSAQQAAAYTRVAEAAANFLKSSTPPTSAQVSARAMLGQGMAMSIRKLSTTTMMAKHIACQAFFNNTPLNEGFTTFVFIRDDLVQKKERIRFQFELDGIVGDESSSFSLFELTFLTFRTTGLHGVRNTVAMAGVDVPVADPISGPRKIGSAESTLACIQPTMGQPTRRFDIHGAAGDRQLAVPSADGVVSEPRSHPH